MNSTRAWQSLLFPSFCHSGWEFTNLIWVSITKQLRIFNLIETLDKTMEMNCCTPYGRHLFTIEDCLPYVRKVVVDEVTKEKTTGHATLFIVLCALVLMPIIFACYKRLFPTKQEDNDMQLTRTVSILY